MCAHIYYSITRVFVFWGREQGVNIVGYWCYIIINMKNKTYIVEGSGSFPLDMLRYDQSYPASEYDSGIMASLQLRKVMLQSSAEHAGGAISKQRWSSFGWTVKPF